MKNFNGKKSFNYLKNIFQTGIGLLIFYLIFSYFKNEITSLDFKKVYQLTLQLGNVKFFFVIFCGLLGITILCLYDYFKSMSSFRIFKISFMTNTLNMVLGFGGFIGAGLRYYMYKPYTKNGKSLATAIGMILVSMLSGISLLSICVVLNIFPGQALYAHNKVFYYCLLLMSLFLPLYLFFNLKKPSIRSDRYLSIKLTVISFLEWVFAALIILIILYFYTGSIVANKELQIMGVIIVASIVGLLSMIPGGMGTFDALVLIGLMNLGIDKEVIGATIIIYRISYYLVPFTIGCLMFLSEGINAVKDKFIKREEKNYDN